MLCDVFHKIPEWTKLRPRKLFFFILPRILVHTSMAQPCCCRDIWPRLQVIVQKLTYLVPANFTYPPIPNSETRSFSDSFALGLFFSMMPTASLEYFLDHFWKNQKVAGVFFAKKLILCRIFSRTLQSFPTFFRVPWISRILSNLHAFLHWFS